MLGLSRFSKDQARILESIPQAIKEFKPLVIPSANSQGKDFLASCIGPWFLYNYHPSKVIITAPTDRQVKEIMWAELETRWNNAIIPLDGRIITCKIEVEPNWYLIGFTTKETGGTIGKAQGFHSQNICVIISEAQAVQDSIFDQLDSILNAENNLLIMIGNPLVTTGKFARAIKDTTHNIVITLDAINSPNYVHKEDVIPGMASYRWIEKKRQEWDPEGTGDHPLWRARVRGLLPKTSIDAVFSLDLVDRMVVQVPRQMVRKIVTSCDPARMGDDECVIYGGVSGRIVKQDILSQSAADMVCSRVLQMVKETNANHITCEADGLGGPICDFINKLKPYGVTLQSVNMSGKPEDEEQFFNLRAEMYWYARIQAEEGKVSIPDDEYLKQELSETRYFYNAKGKIQLEKKEDIKERIGRSPDRADAWVMNIWGQKHAAISREKDVWHEKGDSGEVSSGVKSAMAS